MKVQENQVGLKLHGTHQLLAYVMSIYWDTDIINKNTEIDASKRGWSRSKHREN
jgi:hypothetical protein